MYTIALVGPDGAGKSTVGRELLERLSMPCEYLYMGVNLESSNRVLPTTRLFMELKRLRGGRPDMAGPPDPSKKKAPPKNPILRFAKEAKSLFRIVNLISEEWYRQWIVWRLHKRGIIVLCDRHFFPEYYEYDIVNRDPSRSLARKLHGAVLRRFPKPDLVICLDAPAEVLFARKGEGSIELLEARRRQYLAMEGVVDHFAKVDVSQPLETVIGDACRVVEDFCSQKRSSEPTHVG